MFDEPDAPRGDRRRRCATSTRRCSSPPARRRSRPRSTCSATTSAALRLPLVEADEAELAEVRATLERHGLLAGGRAGVERHAARPPARGLGEIGKNMTVVEYDGRIVVVDTRAALPDRRDDGHRPRAARLHLPARARRRHRGDRHHPRPRGPPRRAAVDPARARAEQRSRSPTAASSRSPWRAPSSTSTSCARPSSRCCRSARWPRPARSSIEMIHLTHSIPDACGVALTTELGTMLITGDYKFDQTPVGGAPADVSRLAELGREGLLLLCGDSTNADRAGHVAQRVGRRPEPRARLRALPRAGSSSRASPRTSTASSRSSTRPPRSTARSCWSAARCARTSTSAARSATSTCPRASSSSRARSTSSPTRSS